MSLLEGEKIIYKDLCYKLNGLFFKVHRDLGRFRKEKQYGDYLEEILNNNEIIYEREYRIISKEKVRDVADFIIDGKILLELKARDFIINEDYNQVKRYLEALNLKLGLIINFRQTNITIKRVLNSNYHE